MIRRFIISCTLLWMVVAYAIADEQRNITLSDDHTEEIVTMPSLCNIFASLVVNDEESVRLSLSIENIREDDNSLLIFGAKYSEKDLKGQIPKFSYGKSFPGSKGMRTTDFCVGVSRIQNIVPSDKKIILSKEMHNGEKQTIHIPIYVAKYKNKKRNAMELMEMFVVELNVGVELKPDEDFIRLSEEVNNFIEKMESKPLCTHRRHKASFEQQKDYYSKQREGLLEQIENIINAHNWYTSDRGYVKYDSLRSELKNIDLDSPKYQTENCGIASLHKSAPRPKARHSCKYCSLSLAQIYHRLDDCYQKIYVSNNRAATKKAVMGDVKALYNCCTDGDCRKHASEWEKGGSYKNKIVNSYNRINAL